MKTDREKGSKYQHVLDAMGLADYSLEVGNTDGGAYAYLSQYNVSNGGWCRVNAAFRCRSKAKAVREVLSRFAPAKWCQYTQTLRDWA